MFGVTFRMVCDLLYGSTATTQCPNWLHSFVLVQFCLAEREFCAILHQFPILAIGRISAQNNFSAHTTAQLCTCCAQKAQCTTVFMALPLSCEQFSEYSCK